MTIIDRAVESFKGNPIREDSNLMPITTKNVIIFSGGVLLASIFIALIVNYFLI